MKPFIIKRYILCKFGIYSFPHWIIAPNCSHYRQTLVTCLLNSNMSKTDVVPQKHLINLSKPLSLRWCFGLHTQNGSKGEDSHFEECVLFFHGHAKPSPGAVTQDWGRHLGLKSTWVIKDLLKLSSQL